MFLAIGSFHAEDTAYGIERYPGDEQRGADVIRDIAESTASSLGFVPSSELVIGRPTLITASAETASLAGVEVYALGQLGTHREAIVASAN